MSTKKPPNQSIIHHSIQKKRKVFLDSVKVKMDKHKVNNSKLNIKEEQKEQKTQRPKSSIRHRKLLLR